MTERITKAIDIFLDALNEGTLAKGTCLACAVGNLVADGLGKKSVLSRDIDEYWQDYLKTDIGLWSEVIGCLNQINNHKAGIEVINKTDFTIRELTLIERAFESNTYISFDRYKDRPREQVRADQIRGLEAVVKVMLEFDDVKEEVKEVFTNKAELIEI